MGSSSLTEWVDALLAQTPGSTEATRIQHAIESLLMAELRSTGRQGAEELVESLAKHGMALERLRALPCMWRVAIAPPRILEIWFTGGIKPVIAALSYRIESPPGPLTDPATAERQAAFYKRYEELDPQITPSSPRDRLILWIGNLEADLNNGGLGQYIGNKGREVANEVLGMLRVIGAESTAAGLAEALESGAEQFALFDQRFAESGDDLPSLVMIYLEKSDQS